MLLEGGVIRPKRRMPFAETSSSHYSPKIWSRARERGTRVAHESEAPVRDAVKAVCPLQCRHRYGAARNNPADQESPDHVDWAGLPTNLDLAFSQAQRDKVYAQHLMRKRQAQLWPWLHDGAQLCVCEIVAEDADLDADAAQSAFSR
jgi:hypothetical protein